jgi:hypothetical protein
LLQSWAVHGLRGLAAVHDDVEKFGALNGGHGAHALALGRERDAPFRLLVGGNAYVADSLHSFHSIDLISAEFKHDK